VSALNRKVLVLDDEPGVLDAYRVILEPAPAPTGIVSSRSRSTALAAAPGALPEGDPFTVQYVSTAGEALNAIRQAVLENNPYVGGFFDVKLGGDMDGIEVIRQAKDIDPTMQFVMVTAYQDRSVDEISRLFGEAFADRWDFLTKPFSRNEIIQKARNLVAQWERKRREKEYLSQIQAQQEQLIQQERLAAVGTLARGIGHEFGNILLGMMGRSELALQKGTPEAMAEALSLIGKSAERASVITRNLQSLVKTESTPEPTDIREPLKDTLLLMEHELKKAGVKLVEEPASQLPIVNVSKVEMGQVFLNLVINAIHAMEEKRGGTLTVKSVADQGGVAVDISDTGCGIPAENLEKIFRPMFTTKGKKGSGIGLSVTQKIVEAHGGKIGVQSKVGQGTLFRIWLPAKR
jgi:two-component system, NtrC family, sensor kinase